MKSQSEGPSLALFIRDMDYRKAAPRPLSRYVPPDQEDSYGDWFTESILPKLDSKVMRESDLQDRERAAFELMKEIQKLQKKLRVDDDGSDIEL